jgi:hypothetical protein
MAVQQMVCTACGSEANASCNCGKPYVPKKQRIVEAIKANPEKSSRAIAEDVGADRRQVDRARQELGGDLSPREGLDGKVYRLPVRDVEDDDIEADIEPDNRRGAFILRADQARVLAAYSGPTDEEILKFARAAAQAWQELVATLQRKMEN